jgi:FMN hydrolase / 5-amino-6-(5-phospho-D-ribitylamino)uracil phosphatase
MLITVDVGHTLGEFTGPGTVDILTRIAARYQGVKPAMVAEVARWFLHVTPALTEELISEVCAYLLIPRSAWPDSWHGGFHPYPYTTDVLSALTHHPAVTGVVALSNLAVTDGPPRMAQLDALLDAWLDGNVPSYAISTRKPHARCWEIIAHRYGIKVRDIVHVGDRIPEDIHGALHAGCRGAILTNTRRVAVPDHLHSHPQVVVVDDLRGIAPIVTTWSTD